jgi:hypothetical protein
VSSLVIYARYKIGEDGLAQCLDAQIISRATRFVFFLSPMGIEWELCIVRADHIEFYLSIITGDVVFQMETTLLSLLDGVIL